MVNISPLVASSSFCLTLLQTEKFDFSVCRNQINWSQLLRRVAELSGVKLTAQAMADLKADPKSFKVVLPDVEGMEPRVTIGNINIFLED